MKNDLTSIWQTIRNFLIYLPIIFGVILIGGITTTDAIANSAPGNFIYNVVVATILLFILPLSFLRLWNKDVPGRYAPAVSHIIIISTVVALLLIYGTYKESVNYFIWHEEELNMLMADLNIEYERRFNLVTNIARSTRSLADHEKDIISMITEARALSYGNTSNQKIEAINTFDKAINSISVNVENYPNITSSVAYNELIENIKTSENRIAISKKNYNESARRFNNYARSIPHSFYVASVVDETRKMYLNQSVPDNMTESKNLLENL